MDSHNKVEREEALSAKQAAPLVGVCAKTVLAMAAAGEIPWFPAGKRKRFTASSLIEWRRQHLQSRHHNHPRAT